MTPIRAPVTQRIERRRVHTLEQHDGELFVQRKRHAPDGIHEVIPRIASEDIPAQHAEFFSNLQYLPLGSVDATGQPWATILCSPKTTITSDTTINVVATVPAGDPFVFSSVISADPAGPRFFAGVGVDFSNRRRNKLAGEIISASLAGNVLSLDLRTNENMGNCPKYITVRQLRPTVRTAAQPITSGRLDDEQVGIVRNASTIFLVTRHTQNAAADEADMGMNHRGGPPGFLRHHFDPDANIDYLYLPDYSGNRFYQSLGNIQTDRVAGLVIPDFVNGHMVHVTGTAENFFDEDAESIIPRVRLVTRIAVSKSVFIRNSINLELVGAEQFSPYNPPVRPLAVERTATTRLTGEEAISASLVSVTPLSSLVSTFAFQLSRPAPHFPPGGFAIFDFSGIFHLEYAHMNNRDPASVNDDLVRTWTVSSISDDRTRLCVTVKKAGRISNFLHRLPCVAEESKPRLVVPLLGVGGEFSCFETGGVDLRSRRMLWVAGGVGITPFLAFHQALVNRLGTAGISELDITLLFSARGDEINLANGLTGVKVLVFDSTPNSATTSEPSFRRRIMAEDFDAIDGLSGMEAFICGPVGFMDTMEGYLKARMDPRKIHKESFAF